MNKQVMKYDVCWDGTMKPEPNGDWIEIEDFEALEASTEKVEAERAGLLEALKEEIGVKFIDHLIKCNDEGIPIVEIWLDGADLWIEVEHDELGSDRSFLRNPPHIIDAETSE